MGELVRLEVDGGIGTIRLDRPPMNALDAQVQIRQHVQFHAMALSPALAARGG